MPVSGLNCSTGAAIQLWCVGCGALWAQYLWSAGLVAPWHVGSEFPDWGWNPLSLNGKADSYSLGDKGRPDTCSSTLLLIPHSSSNQLFSVWKLSQELIWSSFCRGVRCYHSHFTEEGSVDYEEDRGPTQSHSRTQPIRGLEH